MTGGGATIEVKVTFTPTGKVPIELVALGLRSITPISPPSDTVFDVSLPFDIVPGENGGGTLSATVTGTTERGDMVDVRSSDLPVTSDNTQLPPRSCVQDPTTMCVLNNGRFQVEVDWEDFDGNTGQGMVTSGQRFEDGGWFSFAALAGLLNPDGFDLFLRMVNGCSTNGNYWATLIANTDIEYTLTVTDTQTNQSRVYGNPLGVVSPAITDTSAFATCP